MRTRPDLRLYALLDPAQSDRALEALARQTAEGGATLFQLRDKESSTRALVARARAVQEALAPFGRRLLVNDRVDVALAAGAAGVHVGQEDLSPEDARRLLGPDAIIGLTVHSVEEAEAAPVDLLDYVGVGGIFATVSKANPNPPIGPGGLTRIAGVLRRRAPDLPICAIAGITAENTASVIRAGAGGVAVISALSKAADPAAAARRLRAAVDGALGPGTGP